MDLTNKDVEAAINQFGILLLRVYLMGQLATRDVEHLDPVALRMDADQLIGEALHDLPLLDNRIKAPRG